MAQELIYIHRTQGRWHGAALRAMMDTLPDGQYSVALKPMGRRSVPQNNYLHVLFTLAAAFMNQAGYGDGTPWTKETAKDYCKDERLYPMLDMVLPNGEIRQMAKRTRDLTMQETAETIDRVIAHFAVEYRMRLPAPGEQVKLEIAA